MQVARPGTDADALTKHWIPFWVGEFTTHFRTYLSGNGFDHS